MDENNTTNGKEKIRIPTRTVILLVIAMLSVSFSIVGDLQSTGGSTAWGNRIDYFLKAIAYLTLNGFDVLEGDKEGYEFIRLGRVLALLFVIIAAGTILDSLFKIRDRLRLWLTFRNPHDLVIGLGWHGKKLLQDKNPLEGIVPTLWQKLGWASSTIAIDPSPDPLAGELCSGHGIPLLEIDARDEAIPRLAGMKQVKRIFISAGSDDLNIEIARALAESIPKKEPPVVLAVNLEFQKSFGTLQGTLNLDRSIDLHMFNSVSATVRALYASKDYQIDRFTGSMKEAQLVIISDGRMGKELLRQSLQYCIFEKDANVTVDVLSPEGENLAQQWTKEFPCFVADTVSTGALVEVKPKDDVWLKEKVLPIIHFHDLPPSSRGLIDWCKPHVGDRNCVTTVVVAMNDPTDTCSVVDSIGATLQALANALGKDIELWVYINSPDDKLRQSLATTLENRYEDLRPKVFFDYLGKFDRQVAAEKETDDVAKRINAMYALTNIEYENSDTAKPKIESAWKSINENDKDSSRQSAVHAVIKTRIKERLNPSNSDEKLILQILAEIEHRRWCAEYLLRGFKPLTRNLPYSYLEDMERQSINEWFPEDKFILSKSSKKSCKGQFLHVDLVPYESLVPLLGVERGRMEQDKDRQIALLDWVLTGNPLLPEQ